MTQHCAVRVRTVLEVSAVSRLRPLQAAVTVPGFFGTYLLSIPPGWGDFHLSRGYDADAATPILF